MPQKCTNAKTSKKNVQNSARAFLHASRKGTRPILEVLLCHHLPVGMLFPHWPALTSGWDEGIGFSPRLRARRKTLCWCGGLESSHMFHLHITAAQQPYLRPDVLVSPTKKNKGTHYISLYIGSLFERRSRKVNTLGQSRNEENMDCLKSSLIA